MLLNVGVVQMEPEYSLQAGLELQRKNVKRSIELIDELLEQSPVDIVVIPEFAFAGPISVIGNLENTVKDNVDEDVGIVLLRQKAQQRRIYILAPLFLRKETRYFNACSLLNPDGEVVATYFKVHPFPPEKPIISSGTELKTCMVEINGQLQVTGLQMCYDLAFPEGCRSLALQGAKVIFYPTMAEDWLMDYFETFATARAIENRVFVVVANSVGVHPRTGGKLSGRSLVAAPDGKVTSVGEGEKVQSIQIDLHEVDRTRSRLDFLADRYPKAYTHLIID